MKDLDKRLNEIQAELTELRKMVEPEQPYIPQPGEVVEVSDAKAIWHKKIFIEMHPGMDMIYLCVDKEDEYRNGRKYSKLSWRYCRRLSGEIIEFGCDKVKSDSAATHGTMKFEIDLTNPESEIKADYILNNGDTITEMSATASDTPDEIHDALKYLNLLPKGYCFCEEADAELWVKVELLPNDPYLYPVGYIMRRMIVDSLKPYYRPICKIQPGKHPKTNERTSRIFNSAIDSPQVRTDYSHLLPDGYEFCKEEEAEKFVKVRISNPNNQYEFKTGTIVDDKSLARAGVWSPIRKIKQTASGYVTCTRNGIVPESEVPEGLKKLMQEAKHEPEPNTYQVDWSNAPEWADSHAFDVDSIGYWYGALAEFGYWDCISENSTFTLQSGLDWKQSKTRRPV